MAQTTDSLRLNLQATGSNDNIWGEVLNKQFTLTEAAIAGTQRITLSANDYDLSTNAGAEDEARSAVLNIVGAPAEDLNVIVPDVSKIYLVRNNTTGSHGVTVRTKLGAGVAVVRDSARWLYCDGTDVHFAATAEDTRLVAGMVPGSAVSRDVDHTQGSGYADHSLLSVAAADDRYVHSANVTSIGNFTTGDVKLTFKNAEPGWILMADGTIGPTGVGATARANDDTRALYTLLWDNVTDQWAGVAGGRGASAADDWAAGKPMRLPATLGRALAVANHGGGLSQRDLGETLGEEDHALSLDELPSIRPSLSVANAAGGDKIDASTDAVTGRHRGTIIKTKQPIDAVGGNQTHNNMQPSTFVNVLIKL